MPTLKRGASTQLQVVRDQLLVVDSERALSIETKDLLMQRTLEWAPAKECKCVGRNLSKHEGSSGLLDEFYVRNGQGT